MTAFACADVFTLVSLQTDTLVLRTERRTLCDCTATNSLGWTPSSDTSQPFTLKLQPPIMHANSRPLIYEISTLISCLLHCDCSGGKLLQWCQECHKESSTSDILFELVLSLWGDWGITILADFFPPQFKIIFLYLHFSVFNTILYKRMHQQSHSLNVWYKINVYDESTRWTVAPHDIWIYCSVLMILFCERMIPLCFKAGPLFCFDCMSAWSIFQCQCQLYFVTCKIQTLIRTNRSQPRFSRITG